MGRLANYFNLQITSSQLHLLTYRMSGYTLEIHLEEPGILKGRTTKQHDDFFSPCLVAITGVAYHNIIEQYIF